MTGPFEGPVPQSDDPARSSTGRPWPGDLILGVGAALLCFVGSWVPSIWADEGATVSASTRSVPQLLALVRNIDAVHGAYYLVMHVWFELVKVDALTLRLPSSVAAGLSVLLLARLVREVTSSSRLAVTAALFCAVLPRMTWAGIEGRSSAFSTAAALLASLLLLSWIRRGGAGRATLYAITMAVGTWFHLYVALLLLPHVAAVLYAGVRGRKLAGYWLSAALALCLSAPVVRQALSQSAQVEGVAEFDVGRWARQVLVNQNFLGDTPGTASLEGLAALWLPAAILLSVVGWSLVVAGLLSIRRVRDRRRDLLVLLCLSWALVPSLVVGAYSLLFSNLYNPRYFAFCVPATAVLMAVGLGSVRSRRVKIVAVLLIASCCACTYASQRSVNSKQGADWVEVADYLRHAKQPGEGVYFLPDSTSRTIAIAYPSAFAGLEDITLLRSAADDNSLAGESAALSTALKHPLPSTIWAVGTRRALQHPQEIEQLARAGYASTVAWSGPTDVIFELTRGR